MTMGLVNAARQIEAYGRGPDTSLAHISPDESAMLDYMQGGRRMNPITGLPEYSLFGKILKAVAKIGASTVGFMYGGPLGAAAASAAVSKLTGDSWKSALTTGAISGLTSGLGSYASGVGKGATGLSKLGEIATTSGNTIAANAASNAANVLKTVTPNVGSAFTTGSNLAMPGITTAQSVAPSFVSGAAQAAPGITGVIPGITTQSLAPSFVSGAAQAAAPGITGVIPGLTALPAAASTLAPSAFGAFGSNLMKSGYGALGAAVGSAIPNKATPATPPPPLTQLPYDPNNVFSYLRPNRGALTEEQIKNKQLSTPTINPTDIYSQQYPYADGGPVGMGLPQSAAVPQLMSAAQFGYLNARTGGRIAGPGDGKSDDIPALLSNGEHVIDASTVSDLGNGDNDTGQKRLEEIKQKIRNGAGRKNPHKASPKQKGLGLLLKSARA